MQVSGPECCTDQDCFRTDQSPSISSILVRSPRPASWPPSRTPWREGQRGDWLTSHLSLSGLSPVTTEGATRQTVRTFTPSRLISTRCGRSFNWTENEAVISHDDAPSLTQWASHHAWTVWAWCKYRHWDGAEEKMCRMSQIKYLLFGVLWYSICLWPQLMYSYMYCVIWLLFDMLHIKWQQILIN